MALGVEVFNLFGSLGVDPSGANKALDSVDQKGEATANNLVSVFKKAAGLIAAVFTIDKLIDFGRLAIESAASAKAISAQFEQVFGDMQDEATESISAMAAEFDMAPNRLKPGMTKMTAMFKGLGMSTEDAMAQAETAVRLTADAAAFYDVSFESANSSLASFIKGNYEGGEAIGIFANDTQMAQFAISQGIVSSTAEWQRLDEATKQATRLEYAENMYTQSGAIGQASRESEGYENQMGNLKQAWEDFLAIVGGPILGTFIGVLQKLSGGLEVAGEWVQNAVEKIKDFADWVSQTDAYKKFTAAIDSVKAALGNVMESIKKLLPTGDQLKTALQNIVQRGLDLLRAGAERVTDVLNTLAGALAWAKENSETIKTVLGVLAGVFILLSANTIIAKAQLLLFNAANAVLTGVLGATTAATNLMTGATTASAAATARATLAVTAHKIGALAIAAATKIATAAQWLWNAAMAANPIGLIIIAIAALVAIVAVLAAALNDNKRAEENLQAAQDRRAQAVTDLESAQRGLKDSTDALADAEMSLEGSQLAVERAQRSYNEAVEQYGEDSLEAREAAHSLSQAEARLEESKEAVTTAEQNKTQATQDAAAAQGELTAATNAERQAEADLAEAQANDFGPKAQAFFTNMGISCTAAWDVIKTKTGETWGEIKTTLSDTWEGIKASVSEKIEAVKTTVSNVFNGVKTTVTTIWNKIKTAITKPIETAKNTIKGIIDKVSGFFSGAKLEFPKIKLPHFSITGKFSLDPISTPKLSVDWYAKGGILDGATIFGAMGSNLMGGGEAGREAVLPLNRETLGGIGAGIAATIQSDSSIVAMKLDAVVTAIRDMESAYGELKVVMDSGALVGQIRREIDSQLGSDSRMRVRGVAP